MFGKDVFELILKACPAFIQQPAEAVGPEFPDVFVGVLRAVHAQDAHFHSHVSEHPHGLVGGVLPRFIRIVGDNDLFGVLGEDTRMVGRNRRSERCHGKLESRGMQGDNVHIPLAQNHALRAAMPRIVERKQMVAFLESGRIRCVQVFGLAVVENAAAERHDIARSINNRKDYAVAEIVVCPTRFLALSAEERDLQFLVCKPFFVQIIGQASERVRRKTEAEMLDGGFGQPAGPFEIVHPRSADFGIEQAGAEEFCRFEVGFQYPFAGNAAFAAALAHLPRQGKPRAVGQKRYGVGKIKVFRFLNERNRRSPRMAPEAEKHVFARRYRERRGLFTMERTKTDKVRACPFERYIPADQFFNVGAVQHFLHKVFGKSHAVLSPFLVFSF